MLATTIDNFYIIGEKNSAIVTFKFPQYYLRSIVLRKISFIAQPKLTTRIFTKREKGSFIRTQVFAYYKRVTTKSTNFEYLCPTEKAYGCLINIEVL